MGSLAEMDMPRNWGSLSPRGSGVDRFCCGHALSVLVSFFPVKSQLLTKYIFPMLSHFSCVRLFVTLYTVGPAGSSVHGILQARILEWVAMPSSRGSFLPGNRTCVSCIAGGFFTAEPLFLLPL